ncbi:MAG: carbohydrate-binding domain-containing protein [Ruminococcus sp.]|jgi:hypothetical protein|nr:carbohydrate-binding domain-containing protein [Ruminococcus sp.]
MNKKIISVLVSVILAGVLAGCNNINPTGPEKVSLAEISAADYAADITPTATTAGKIEFSAANPEITITKGGSYTVTGSVKNGRLIVNAGSEAVTLTLDDVDITSERGPALRIRSAKSVEIKLPKDTNSVLTSTTRDDDSSAIYSLSDLTVSGSGSLTLSSNGAGIDASRKFNMNGGTLTVAKSEEGIEAAEVNVKGGTISITSREDGINIDGADRTEKYSQTGGKVYINAGGDGLDSKIYVSGGTLIIEGSTRLDNMPIEFERVFEVTGGTIFTTGSTFGTGRNVFPTGGKQTFIAANVAAGAGDTISVKDKSGNEIASLITAKKVSVIFVSAAKLKSGESYTVTVKDAQTEKETTAGTVTAGVKPSVKTPPRYDDDYYDDDWDDYYDDDRYDYDDRYDDWDDRYEYWDD